MKKRNLSGIYFRVKNEDTGKFENVCFEEMTEQQQDKVMSHGHGEWLKTLCKQLANTINAIGEQLDLSRNYENND